MFGSGRSCFGSPRPPRGVLLPLGSVAEPEAPTVAFDVVVVAQFVVVAVWAVVSLGFVMVHSLEDRLEQHVVVAYGKVVLPR